MASSLCGSPRKSRCRFKISSKSFKDSPSSGTLSRRLTKSASDLSQHSIPYSQHNSSSKSPVHHISVVQKTHYFFSTLKERWIRNRARHKTTSGPKNLSAPPCDTPPPLYRQQSGVTDGGYTTDNSSDCSTPLTRSPQHRLYSNASSLRSAQENSGIHSMINPLRSSDQEFSSKLPLLTNRLTPPDCQEELTLAEELARTKANQLRQYSFFQLKIHLKRGRDLIARDKTGTSDPYVKFKIGGRLMYKSKTIYRDLNPTWDETCVLPIEDPFEPVLAKVTTPTGLVLEMQVGICGRPRFAMRF
uniref:Multiple C2 and transmembrane domain-containing protein 2 n=1 Tax=Cacopsylla melanoneura TaxID=428564 RepID=A0A8D8MGQ2_9HEMI